MIVLLGGFLGSGRNFLARELSKHPGVHLYDKDRHRIKRFAVTKGNRLIEQVVRHKGEDDRMRIYQAIASDFPQLSKLHDIVVIKSVLYRAKSREYLLAQARKHFKPVIFVWVESTEEGVRERIEKMKMRGIVRDVELALKERAESIKKFEPFSEEPIRFFYKDTPEVEGERLWKMLQALKEKSL